MLVMMSVDQLMDVSKSSESLGTVGTIGWGLRRWGSRPYLPYPKVVVVRVPTG